MKNKIKLIPYLFAFNVLATLFTLAWMTVMFPYHLFCALVDSFNQIFALAKRENKRIWDAVPYSKEKQPIEPKETKIETPQWLQ